MSLTAFMVSARDHPRAVGAVAQHRDRYRRGRPASRFISAPIGPSFATARSTSAGLEARELRAAEFVQHVGLRRVVGQRRVDADQVVGLRTRLQTLLARTAAARDRSCALRTFWAMVSASSVRLMRE